MAKSGQDRHWNNLVAAVYAYGQQVGGCGSVTLKINFNEGVPVQLDVLCREERCRLDRGLAPAPYPAGQLTGVPGRDILADEAG